LVSAESKPFLLRHLCFPAVIIAWYRSEGGILERFVDFWEVVEWGLGLSYNSGFSILQFLQFDAILVASAAAVSTLYGSRQMSTGTQEQKGGPQAPKGKVQKVLGLTSCPAFSLVTNFLCPTRAPSVSCVPKKSG
jgi:hypothetical protein